MNGEDKILNRIKSDCDNNIKAINAEAQAKCDAIMKDAEAEIEKRKAESDAKAAKKVALINSSAKTGAELEMRNAVLKKRREEINLTLDMLREHLLNLSDKDYFEALYKLAAQLKGQSGTVYLNKKDLARMPADFTDKLKASGVEADVSENAVDICGGFILKRGDIEENMDFDAIISSRRDELEDLINRELFIN